MRNCDYLIVGGGIAGMTVASYLEKNEQDFLIVNEDLAGAATKVSSGVINPVTGQRFVLSWKYEELKTEFLEFYQSLEKKWTKKFIEETQLYQILRSAEEQNLWLSRTADPVYQPYFGDVQTELPNPFKMDELHTIGIIKSMYVVQIKQLIQQLENHFILREKYLQTQFDFNELVRTEDKLQWKDIKIQKAIIFAEGYRVLSNPFFNWLPIIPLKGECLQIRIPGVNSNIVFKSDYAIVPLTESDYWIGSNFYLFETELQTSEVEKQNQLSFLNRVLSDSFQLKKHLYGIRPASRDRRPVIDTHPCDSRLIVFNGLGTKGLSLAPYCAKHLMEFLLNNIPIPKDLNLMRFKSKGFEAVPI